MKKREFIVDYKKEMFLLIILEIEVKEGNDKVVGVFEIGYVIIKDFMFV